MEELHRETAFISYRRSYINTKKVVSVMAFLIGVPDSYFSDEASSFDPETKRVLERDRNAVIIRSLCTIRTSILRNYSYIHSGLIQGAWMKDLLDMSLVDKLSLNYGINITPPKNSTRDLRAYLQKINSELGNKVEAIKRLFPQWINWSYIRPLFLMPNAKSLDKIQAESINYNKSRKHYPFQCYINLYLEQPRGLILRDDEAFLSLVYEQNTDCFRAFEYVRVYENYTRHLVNDFLSRGPSPVFMVDCSTVNLCHVYGLFDMLTDADRSRTSVKLFVPNCHRDIWERYWNEDWPMLEICEISEDESYAMSVLSYIFERQYNYNPPMVIISGQVDVCHALTKSLRDRMAILPIVATSTDRSSFLDLECAVGFLEDYEESDVIDPAELVKYCVEKRLKLQPVANLSSILNEALRNVPVPLSEETQNIVGEQIRSNLRVDVRPDGQIFLTV